jgi:hypothetical protein
MLPTVRAKGTFVAAVAAVAVVLALSGAPAARAHQCVEVQILRAPAAAAPGALITTQSSATNCGDPARGFNLSWVLVSEKNDQRFLLKKTVGKIEPGRTISGFNRLLLPAQLRPGVYHLVLAGHAPSGFVDREAVRIVIRRPATRR